MGARRTWWEHVRQAPCLALAKPPKDGRPAFISQGQRHWQAHYDRRHQQHAEVNQRWRRGQRVMLERERRSEVDEQLVRFCVWALEHCDARSRLVGVLGPGGSIVPFSLNEICDELRDPRTGLRLPIWTLCRLISILTAARYITTATRASCKRHQAREHDKDADGRDVYRGKVADLRLTEFFFQASRCAQLRERSAEKQRRRAMREQHEQSPARELARTITNSPAALAVDRSSAAPPASPSPAPAGWDAEEARQLIAGIKSRRPPPRS